MTMLKASKLNTKTARKMAVNALVTAFVTVFGLGLFNSWLIDRRKDDISYRITSVAEYQLKSVFSRYVSIADNWTALLMANDGTLDQDRFNEICEKLFAQYHDPAIRCMQLSPNGVITYSYPLKGFESAIGKSNFGGHRRLESLAAKESGNATMGGPYKLTQGGIACIIRDPLYLKDGQGKKQFWGFATLILRYPEVLKAVDMEGEGLLYDYKISHLNDNTGEPEIILESSDKALTDPVSVEFDVPNRTWTLSAEWKGGWITRRELLLELLLTLVLATLAGAFTHAYERRHSDERAMRNLIEDSNVPLSVVARDGSEVFLCNGAFSRFLGSSEPFQPGLSLQKLLKGSNFSLSELLNDRATVVTDLTGKNSMVIRSSKLDWKGTPAVLLRGRVYDLEYFDSLTLLPNQFYFEKQAPGVIRKLKRKGQAVCVYYNIVGMKYFNAENGFAAGDTLLKETAETLRDVYGDTLLARFNNDNFCLLTAREGLEKKLEEAHRRIALLGGASPIDVKAGIYELRPDGARSVSQIIDAAKMATDSIHDALDRHCRYYDDELRQQLMDKRFIRDHLDQALADGEFQVYYQPVIRALTGQLAGYEALVRWNSKELGFLPPGRFIPILEQSRQITGVDTFVIREICRRYREAVDAGRPVVPVSFNLSRVDLLMADMCRIITEAAAAYRVPHNMLRVEITESILMNSEEKLLREIKRFHEAGFQVWMDDFGSGYSNLNTLKDFDFDVIKLDMKFLSSMTEKSRSILRSTIAMATQVGIETLAEGCETTEHYDFLRAIGCEKIQGWYFGKPLPLEEGQKDLYAKGIREESPEDAAFYHAAGKLLYPLHQPFAIVEKNKGQYHFLYWNRAYEKLTKDTIGSTMEEIDDLMNLKDASKKTFLDGKLQQMTEGRPEKIIYPYEGTYVILTLCLLKKEGDRQLLWLMNEGSRG